MATKWIYILDNKTKLGLSSLAQLRRTPIRPVANNRRDSANRLAQVDVRRQNRWAVLMFGRFR